MPFESIEFEITISPNIQSLNVKDLGNRDLWTKRNNESLKEEGVRFRQTSTL
jgi:hypothetical protein